VHLTEEINIEFDVYEFNRMIMFSYTIKIEWRKNGSFE